MLGPSPRARGAHSATFYDARASIYSMASSGSVSGSPLRRRGGVGIRKGAHHRFGALHHFPYRLAGPAALTHGSVSTGLGGAQFPRSAPVHRRAIARRPAPAALGDRLATPLTGVLQQLLAYPCRLVDLRLRCRVLHTGIPGVRAQTPFVTNESIKS